MESIDGDVPRPGSALAALERTVSADPLDSRHAPEAGEMVLWDTISHETDGFHIGGT